MVLLIGVLALSWRLNNDPSTRPSVSQNTLTPGIGFVDDDNESAAEVDTLTTQANEEVNLANGKESPFHNHCVSPPCDSRTLTTKHDDRLSITRMRRNGITESEEIWEELEDDALAELSPFSYRRSSVRSTPSKSFSHRNAVDDDTDESTALLARSGTGRNYRDRRRRRSTPNLETRERERGRKSALSQELLGSWLKIQSWWRGEEMKDKGKDTGNGNRDGNGDSA